MTARQWLDAEFINSAPAAVDSTVPARADDSPNATSANTGQVQEAAEKPAPGQEQVAAQGQAGNPPAEPLVIGSADRIWARLEIKPKPGQRTGSATGRNKGGERRAEGGGQGTDDSGRSVDEGRTRREDKTASSTKPASKGPRLNENSAEIRKVWMWGSVSLHQDPEQGKTKGQDASGEALYLDNRGKDKIITEIYQRDPNEKTYLPGPLPPAQVENQDIKIAAAGILKMNQETDEAQVEGPGTLTQFNAKPTALPVNGDSITSGAAGDAAPRGKEREPQAGIRDSSALAQNEPESDPGSSGSKKPAPAARPKTRAGRPVSRSTPTTIAFSERMEFTGRTADPDGKPAARADFYGIVTAWMEDALLHCEEKMIAYTDRVVPLAQLGAMSRSRPKAKPGGDVPESENAQSETDDQPQLTLISCYRKALAINRVVDADTPTVLEKRRIEADDVLDYDRRTGEFAIPGKGIVYLYDRSDNSSRAPGMSLDPKRDGSRSPAPVQRTVTPTSGRAPSRSSRSAGGAAPSTRPASSPGEPKASTESKTGEFPPLVLTQISFNKGMRGRVAAGQQDEKVATNWYEFFGDIQLARAKVPDAQPTLNFDKLPNDGLFLTSQTLRVRSEPPPIGSPPSTPARDYVKAWEKAYVWSNDKSLQSDVITYDSEKDLIYAFGEQGRGVIYAQQHAAGQPSSLGTAKAMRLNPKTGAMHFIDNASVQVIDKNSGARPDVAKPVDPDARKPKPPRKPFRLPSGNVERRGFSGQ
jgi:hypothetical protein